MNGISELLPTNNAGHTQAKKNDIKQKHEKVLERKKSVVRVVNTLVRIPGSDSVEALSVLLEKIKTGKDKEALVPLLTENLEHRSTDAMEIS